MVGSAANLIDAATGDLVLQIRGTARDGQVVRIRSGKCTIGSGPRCTLRLHARGVSPLHCLILRGSRTTVIRRWAPDTRLNNRTFRDAALVPGDRLSIGPIELDVLQTAPPAEGPPGAVGQASSPPPLTSPTVTQLPSQLCRRLEVANQQGRERARRLLEQLRKARREIARLQQQNQTTEQSERVEQARTELQTQEQGLDDRRRQWDAQLAKADQRLQQRAAELDARAEELEVQQQALQQQRRRWEEERSGADSASAEQSAELQSKMAQLEAQRTELQQQRRRWDSERAELQERFDRQSGELDLRRAELEVAEEMFRQQREEAAARDPETEPAGDPHLPQEQEAPGGPRSPSQAGAPVDTAEVLRQMGAVPLLPDDEPEEDPEVRPEPAAERSARTSPPAPEPPGNENESIDDYMARLLERVRGGAGEQTRPSKPSPPASQPAAPERRPAEEAPAEPQPERPRPRPGAPKRRGPVDMSPRAVAPEKTVDLSAMRALANDSAQSAIDRHALWKTGSAIRTKLLVTILGLAAGGAMTWIWWAKDAPVAILYAAGAAFVLAGFWALQYLILAGVLMVRRSRMRGRQVTRERNAQAARTEPAGQARPTEPGRAKAAGWPNEVRSAPDEAPKAAGAQQPPSVNDSLPWRELARAASNVPDEGPAGEA